MINQDCYVSMGIFDRGRQVHYSFYKRGRGIYIYPVEGNVHLEGEMLNAFDGMGLTGAESLHMEFKETSRVLLFEVPRY